MKKHINNIELENIIKFYEDCKSIRKTAEKFNRKSDTISIHLKKSNIKNFIPKEIKISMNENYFDNIDTEAKAYFLGLLMADGYNSGKFCRITLIDKEILEVMKREIEITGRIYEHKPKISDVSKKTQYILNIPSEKLCKKLIELDVIKRKSHFTKFPNINKNLRRHFIRGVFDGDGCIGIYPNRSIFTIIGNVDLIQGIQDIISEECKIDKNKLLNNKRDKVNIVSLRWSSISDLLKIQHYIYDNSYIFIDRKREKFMLIKENYETRKCCKSCRTLQREK